MQQETLTSAPPPADGASKKSFAVPTVRRETRMALVTAGSFDLILPGI